jgi:hypothetical protein
MGWECGTSAPRLTACVRVPFDASFSAGLPSLQSIKGQSTGHPSIYLACWRGVAWRGVRPAPARGVGREPGSLFVWLVADGWCWFVLREKVLLAGC